MYLILYVVLTFQPPFTAFYQFNMNLIREYCSISNLLKPIKNCLSELTNTSQSKNRSTPKTSLQDITKKDTEDIELKKYKEQKL